MGRTGPKNMAGSSSPVTRAPKARPSRPSSHSVKSVAPVRPPSGAGRAITGGVKRGSVKSTPHTKRPQPAARMRPTQASKKI